MSHISVLHAQRISSTMHFLSAFDLVLVLHLGQSYFIFNIVTLDTTQHSLFHEMGLTPNQIWPITNHLKVSRMILPKCLNVFMSFCLYVFKGLVFQSIFLLHLSVCLSVCLSVRLSVTYYQPFFSILFGLFHLLPNQTNVSIYSVLCEDLNTKFVQNWMQATL